MTIASIPLNEAHICLDCNRLTNVTDACVCGSRALWPVMKWLERPVPEEQPEVVTCK